MESGILGFGIQSPGSTDNDLDSPTCGDLPVEFFSRELEHQTFLIHERHGWPHRTGSETRFTRQMQIIKQTNVKLSRTRIE